MTNNIVDITRDSKTIKRTNGNSRTEKCSIRFKNIHWMN